MTIQGVMHSEVPWPVYVQNLNTDMISNRLPLPVTTVNVLVLLSATRVTLVYWTYRVALIQH